MYSVSFLKVSLFIDAQLLIYTFSAGRVPDHFGSSNSVLIKDQCSSNIGAIWWLQSQLALKCFERHGFVWTSWGKPPKSNGLIIISPYIFPMRAINWYQVGINSPIFRHAHIDQRDAFKCREAEAMQMIFQVILLAALGLTSAVAQRFGKGKILESTGLFLRNPWDFLDFPVIMVS